MHHAKRLSLLVLVCALFTSSAFAVDKLTKVERPTCLSFPKILEFRDAVLDVHYKIDEDYNCDDDYNNCSTDTSLELKYKYTTVRTFDYYSADGKLVTTETKKEALNISEKGYDFETHTSDAETLYTSAAAKVRKAISVAIYEHENGACENSFYKE